MQISASVGKCKSSASVVKGKHNQVQLQSSLVQSKLVQLYKCDQEQSSPCAVKSSVVVQVKSTCRQVYSSAGQRQVQISASVVSESAARFWCSHVQVYRGGLQGGPPATGIHWAYSSILMPTSAPTDVPLHWFWGPRADPKLPLCQPQWHRVSFQPSITGWKLTLCHWGWQSGSLGSALGPQNQ